MLYKHFPILIVEQHDKNEIGGIIMSLEQSSDILTVCELCEVLEIGANAAYQLLNNGSIPAFRIGRRWKIPREAVQQYIAQWKNK